MLTLYRVYWVISVLPRGVAAPRGFSLLAQAFKNQCPCIPKATLKVLRTSEESHFVYSTISFPSPNQLCPKHRPAAVDHFISELFYPLHVFVSSLTITPRPRIRSQGYSFQLRSFPGYSFALPLSCLPYTMYTVIVY